ncbi:hypothetical protein BDF21DRAFT_485682 [Thamnidium elegans]|nr:hypothetical protein BDF21DRAFT_485682 [Thamnidium elegans]
MTRTPLDKGNQKKTNSLYFTNLDKEPKFINGNNGGTFCFNESLKSTDFFLKYHGIKTIRSADTPNENNNVILLPYLIRLLNRSESNDLRMHSSRHVEESVIPQDMTIIYIFSQPYIIVPRCNNGLSKQMQYFAALQHRNSYTSEISCFGLEDDPNNVNKARIKSHAGYVTEPNNRQARYEQHHFVVRLVGFQPVLQTDGSGEGGEEEERGGQEGKGQTGRKVTINTFGSSAKRQTLGGSTSFNKSLGERDLQTFVTKSFRQAWCETTVGTKAQ